MTWNGTWAGKRLLCVIAHPDDEVLGCGATLARAAEEGADVRVLLPIVRGCERGRANGALHREQFDEAVRLLGAEPVIANNAMPEVEAETATMALHDVIDPWVDWSEIVFTHWHEDAHQTHRAIARAVEIATRPFRRHRFVVQFEVPTSTDQAFRTTFSPNLFVRLEERHVERKAEAMGLYTTELCPGRTPKSLRRRAALVGERFGEDYGEAFVVARSFM